MRKPSCQLDSDWFLRLDGIYYIEQQADVIYDKFLEVC